MFELPLFPLNTVLFPGVPLRLQIFEPRYRIMILDCIEAQKAFGVVLILKGVEALGPLAEPYTVGCTAQITHVEKVDEGRMNIGTIGVERFRSLYVDRDEKPYLLGTVELFPLIQNGGELLVKRGGQLRDLVQRYLQVQGDSGYANYDINQIPAEPVDIAYLAAALLHTPLIEKQAILSIEHANVLLANLCDIYRREIALLKAVLTKGIESSGPFSNN